MGQQKLYTRLMLGAQNTARNWQKAELISIANWCFWWEMSSFSRTLDEIAVAKIYIGHKVWYESSHPNVPQKITLENLLLTIFISILVF